MVSRSFYENGWVRFGPDPALHDWVMACQPLVRAALAAPDGDWRCGGTWFVGVDALDNDLDGSVAGVRLAGAACDFVKDTFGNQPLHRAQLSTTRPGYPQPWHGESPTAFSYRKNRDAAHIDGLLPVGTEKRRMVREPHAFVLGIPLTQSDPQASPLVIWQGSHKIMGKAFRQVLSDHDPADWADVDVTEAYHEARRAVFEKCMRLALHLRPGEAIVLHRHLLHGVSPWAQGATASPEGRVIAYFRPLLPDVHTWAHEQA